MGNRRSLPKRFASVTEWLAEMTKSSQFILSEALRSRGRISAAAGGLQWWRAGGRHVLPAIQEKIALTAVHGDHEAFRKTGAQGCRRYIEPVGSIGAACE